MSLGSVLADYQILSRVRRNEGDPQRLVISGFQPTPVSSGVISYGLSSYGYDIRLGKRFMVVEGATEIDPKSMREAGFVSVEATGRVMIPPNSFVLAESVERLEMPEDCLALVLGKSTYARCGINLNTTPLEPGWKGVITLEIANMTRLPAFVYVGEGIGQIVFFQGAPCLSHYGNKQGSRYQHQLGLTLPCVS